MIPQVITTFLRELNENNNREWFADNKPLYIEAKSAFEDVVINLISIVSETEPNIDVLSPKECIFRIFRDVRFSKDKTPYKNHFDAFIAKKGGRKSIYAGYFLRIAPENSLFGGGIYAPIPEILKALRQEIYNFPDELKAIINNPDFKMVYDKLYDQKLIMAPKGFPRDFPDVELLKYKSYVTVHPLSDDDLTSPALENKFRMLIKTLYPFNNFLNRAIDYQEEKLEF